MSALFPALHPPHWFVVFCQARPMQARRFGARWLAERAVAALPEGFQHCWAFTPTVAGWLVVNPGMDGLDAGELCGHDLPLSLMLPQNAGPHTLLRVPAGRQGRLRLNLTCATQIASLVGAIHFRGWLPSQLCRHLIDHCEAEVLHDGFREKA